ncbi:MAG: hypothetical protein QM642_01975 [Edaphocola sp.]
MTQSITLYAGGLELAQLPALITKAQNTTAALDAETRPLLDQVAATDFATLEPERGEMMDALLSSAQNKAKDSTEAINAERSPYTKAFDEVKSIFTSEEKKMKDIAETAGRYRSKWAVEKQRRMDEDRRKQQAALDLARDKANYRQAVTDAINAAFYATVKLVADNLNQGYLAATAETLDTVEAKLKGYAPMFVRPEVNFPTWDNHGAEEIKVSVEAEMWPRKAEEFARIVGEERDRLVALIPSRRAELERMAQDASLAAEVAARHAQEEAERQAALAARQAAANEAAANEASAQTMDAAFEQSALAPALEQTKGTTAKLEYIVNTHRDMGLVMQFWVKNNMPLLTPDELKKKLSFMVTAANAALNRGEAIGGLNTQEDLQVRASRSKK